MGGDMKKSIRIVIADDSPTMRKNMCKKLLELFSDIDFTFTEVEDGKKAFECLEEGNTDLLITDRNMPEMCGIELIQKVRADSRYKKMRIVMFSTEGTKSEIIDAAKTGLNGYIVKPYSDNEVIKTFKPLFDRM